MLEEIHVRDLALIREAWVELGPGLNVLSGETGAGKTVLVEALQLLVGERADSTLVRSGTQEALVEGRFLVDGAERAARRRVSAEGRSRCYLDGGMASVGELAEELGPLVDLHGQHDHQALLSPQVHAEYLERFAGDDVVSSRKSYGSAHRTAGEAHQRLDALREALADSERRHDSLAFVISDIDAAAPAVGEDEALEASVPRMRHAERLTEASSTAFRALRDEEGAQDAIAVGISAMESVRGIDDALDAVLDLMEEGAATLDEAGTRLRSYADSIDHDPRALDVAESRLATLADLKRKYGPSLEDVVSRRDQAAEEIGRLESGEGELARARAEVDAAEEALDHAVARLKEGLDAAAPRFVERLSEASTDLSMGAARFQVLVERLPREQWSERTPLRVEFLFSSSAGDPPRPLVKVASGGEVSRVMLALKSVLGEADETPVLVFDEVDAGIGGATATAVGRRLADIARGRQVVVVTHLAQVAAFADRHLVVAKSEEADGSVTTVHRVEADERVAELARMLAGTDSETGLAHARELLATVEGPV